jgi:hypothetical protein
MFEEEAETVWLSDSPEGSRVRRETASIRITEAWVAIARNLRHEQERWFR